MGWTCQYDHQGFCKRVKTMCEPGMKGCILQTTGIVFASQLDEHTPCPEDKEQEKKKEEIDFAALARSN